MIPPFVGRLPLEIVREAEVEVVTVTEEEIVEAMRFLFSRAKLVTEGSGAAATAALLTGKASVEGPAAVLVSGGNVDPARMRDQVLI
jgi:threonine dehydratase